MDSLLFLFIFQRLEILHESDPTKYLNLIEMLKKEDCKGNARKGTSCNRAFLWLTGQGFEQAAENSSLIHIKITCASPSRLQRQLRRLQPSAPSPLASLNRINNV
ncbi:hypothetical protein PTKIN_Ptkin01aG0133700 [Pterospermum kingtungense]